MQARRLPAARGISWVIAGFSLYRRGPALLVLLTMLYLTIAVASGLFAPAGPLLLSLAQPALTVLVANACRHLDDPAGSAPGHTALIDGLAAQGGLLLRLGVLQLAGMALVLGVDRLLDAADGSIQAPDAESLQLEHLFRVLAIGAPMIMAFWFAPLLAAWERVPAAKSLFFSFVAALRNWRAFLAYGAAVAAIGAALPALLLSAAAAVSPAAFTVASAATRMALFLVLLPMLMGSAYLSYRDVFAKSVDVDA